MREFYLSNATYWIDEFHLDGFRFDATQNIYDSSPKHILNAIREKIGTCRRFYLIGENEPQDSRLLSPEEGGQTGASGALDALWNDDFHHACKVALTGRNEGYHLDYAGSAAELLSLAKWGFLFQGQNYFWQENQRGSNSFRFNADRFITFIQNHDQIANYGMGKRIHEICSYADYKTITAFLLLAPQTPMIFQGQEFASSSPFHYFGDQSGELALQMEQGRKIEASQFPTHALRETQDRLTKPSDPHVYECCKLNYGEREQGMHAEVLTLHRDLIALRKSETAVFGAQNKRLLDGSLLSANVVLFRFFSDNSDAAGLEDRLLILNLGSIFRPVVLSEPLIAAPRDYKWECYWSTESARYGGFGFPQPQGRDIEGHTRWTILQHSATLFRPIKVSDEEKDDRKQVAERHELAKKANMKRQVNAK